MTVENTFAVNWVLALKQVTIWTAERCALLQRLSTNSRERRRASAAVTRRTDTVAVGSSDPFGSTYRRFAAVQAEC